MRRGCKKTKPSSPRGRKRTCHYWLPGACEPHRARSRYSPWRAQPGPDPCLGERRLSGRADRR
jgi:hypothetical protein